MGNGVRACEVCCSAFPETYVTYIPSVPFMTAAWACHRSAGAHPSSLSTQHRLPHSRHRPPCSIAELTAISLAPVYHGVHHRLKRTTVRDSAIDQIWEGGSQSLGKAQGAPIVNGSRPVLCFSLGRGIKPRALSHLGMQGRASPQYLGRRARSRCIGRKYGRHAPCGRRRPVY